MDRGNERKRIREIASVFLKYGIKDGIHTINDPVKLRLALEDLGPTFIKIGQILSTRPDILPESYIREFQKLQDNVKAEKYEDIKAIIEQQLNGAIEDVFLYFNQQPMACASMAEVHEAILRNGQKVVVKIQRPGAKQMMFSDIAILRRLTLFMKFVLQGKVLNPTEVLDELYRAVEKELDFLNEAEHMKKFYENHKNIKYVTCPRVYEQYTTSSILVMEYIKGIKIADVDRLKAEGYDLRDMAVKLSLSYLKQIFEDGFFHADPHPGNILITGTQIVYIDFGLVGNLSEGLQQKFNTLLYSVATRDLELMTRSILKIGIKKGATIDTKKLHSDIEEIYNTYMDASFYDINIPQLMDEVFKTCRKNNIVMPAELTMLLKGLMTLEGVVAKIAPELDIMDIATPYVKKQMLKKRNLKQDFLENMGNLYTVSKVGLKLPIKLHELMNSVLAGKLKVQIEHTTLEKSMYQLSKMANRIVFGLIVSSLIIGSSLVINANVGPKIFDISILGLIGYIGAAITGLWLLISILRSGMM